MLAMTSCVVVVAEQDFAEEALQLASKSEPPVQRLIDTGVANRLLDVVQHSDNLTAQISSAQALAKLATACSTAQLDQVVQPYVIPILLPLVSSPIDKVKVEAATMLAKIATDSSTRRDMVLQEGAVQPLLAQLQGASSTAWQRSVTRALNALCDGVPLPDFEALRPAWPVVEQLILSAKHHELLADVCSLQSRLVVLANEHKVDIVVPVHLCRRLVRLLKHTSVHVRLSTLVAVCNIAMGSTASKQNLIDADVLRVLLSLLTTGDALMRNTACQAVGFLSHDSKAQVQSVFDSGLAEAMVRELDDDNDLVRQAALRAISVVIAKGSKAHVQSLARLGCLDRIDAMLTASDLCLVNDAVIVLEGTFKVASRTRDKSMLDAIARVDVRRKIVEVRDRNLNESINTRCNRILLIRLTENEKEDVESSLVSES